MWRYAGIVAANTGKTKTNLDNVDSIDLDGDGTPEDLDEDLDGDKLSNRKELEIRTNPLLADSDGDKYDDFEEINFNPLLNPARSFHPLIADIPQIKVEIVKNPAFYLITEAGTETGGSKTIIEGTEINRETSTSYGNSRSFGNEVIFRYPRIFSDCRSRSFYRRFKERSPKTGGVTIGETECLLKEFLL